MFLKMLTNINNEFKFILPLIISVSAFSFSQMLKIIIRYVQTGKFDMRGILSSGGMPSAHAATAAALSTSIGILAGAFSFPFAIAITFSLMFIYDAANIRYYAGLNIKVTKQIIIDLKENPDMKDNMDDPIYSLKIKDVLGHTVLEVLVGIVIGLIIGSLALFI